ncbi:MAG: sulfatase-like hydrolase/transferase [Armatimonadota bacterium]|nr:sulfatase-like hydrolase/transferase [Armatimonadota bacterium]
MTTNTLSLTRRGFLQGAASAAVAHLAGSSPILAAAATPRRPNVVFILTDDQDFNTLGCFGGKVLTPHIDRLAKEGVRFTRAYAVSSICTPSRYTCLTGKYASRSEHPPFLRACPPGTPANVAFNVAIVPEEPNLAQWLKNAGYATGFVGKWHTGGPGMLPCPRDGKLDDPKVAEILATNHERLCGYIRSCGFDYAASVYRGNLADHKLDALDVHNPEWITQGALDFIQQHKDRPFFLHLCTTLHHSPHPVRSLRGDWRVTPAGLLKEPLTSQPSRQSVFQRVREAGFPENTAHCTWLDDCVGAVVQKLEALGLADNTLIVYFSDNNVAGGKATCYDGGAHTPAFMYWKGRLAAGTTCDALVQNTDFAPTILDACQVPLRPELKLDGDTLLPLAQGRTAPWRDTALLEVGHSRAVVHGRWKYIAVRYPAPLQKRIDDGTLGRPPYHGDTTFDLHAVAARAHPAYFDRDQLYDLEKDPLEKNNLAALPEHAAVLAEMKARLKERLAAFPRPFGEFR